MSAPDQKLLIREMVEPDLESVIGIERRSFLHPWTRRHFIAELSHGAVSRCRVAVVREAASAAGPGAWTGREKIVGFVMAWLVADELHITNLAVEPEVRRGGVAAALLDHSLAEAASSGAVWCQLEVRVSNSAARSLYTGLGFKPLGTRKGYYSDGEDAMVMGKELGDDPGPAKALP